MPVKRIAFSLQLKQVIFKRTIRSHCDFIPKKTGEHILLLREYDLKSKGVMNRTSDGELLKEMVTRMMF